MEDIVQRSLEEEEEELLLPAVAMRNNKGTWVDETIINRLIQDKYLQINMGQILTATVPQGRSISR